ncbi:MAG: N-methylproline demethylase, partial [Arenicellales bacterium]
VCGLRGHRVTLYEAASRAGGQILLASKVERRREIVGITEWLIAEVEAAGVEMVFNRLAEACDVLADEPDVVVIATGGIPNTGFLSNGEELVTTTWDILGGTIPPGREVLLFDDNGQHQGLSCAEYLVHAGSRIEILTPDRMIGQEVGGTNIPAYLRTFYENGVKMSVNRRLVSVEPEGRRLKARLHNEFTDTGEERVVDQVVVEHGTLPVDDLYFELKDSAINRGETDPGALMEGRLEEPVVNPEGRFHLFRVGDAVSSRNIHSAIYDSLRICKDL